MAITDVLKALIDSQTESVRIKSQVMRPALAIMSGGIVAGAGLCFLGTSLLSRSMWLGGAVTAIGIAVMLASLGFAAWQYVYFARTDPDRLGSETFLTKQRVIEAIERSKDPNLLRDGVRELIEDPYRPRRALTKGGGRSDEGES